MRILTERRAPPVGFDWHRHFVTHPSNGALAKLVVYTAGQTPGQTWDALYKGLVRTPFCFQAATASSLPCRLRRLADDTAGHRGRPHQRPSWEPSPPDGNRRRSRRPCHQLAIHSGHDRSRADTTHNAEAASTCAVPLPSQVTTLPDLALGARGSTLPTQLSNSHKLRNSEHNHNRSPRDPQR